MLDGGSYRAYEASGRRGTRGAIGQLYDHSLIATIGFCFACQFAAIPFFLWNALDEGFGQYRCM